MKQKLLLAVLTTMMVGTAFAATTPAPTATAAPAAQAAAPSINLATDADKLSYVLGLNIGSNLHSQQINVNQAAFDKGLNDALTGAAPQMTPAQMQEVITKFQKDMVTKRTAELKVQSAANLKAGDAFMKDFAAKKGVQTLGTKDKSILYRVVIPGNGALPKATDTAVITYTGKLVNGQVFDSTDKTGGKAIDLPIARMIPGMQMAIEKMPVGSTWEVVIPPALAYGEMGIPLPNSPIGPNATLVFDLALQGVKPTAAPAPAAK